MTQQRAGVSPAQRAGPRLEPGVQALLRAALCSFFWLAAASGDVDCAERLVVSHIDGVGPAGVRIAPLFGVEPVVTPVGSWLAADSARCDQRVRAGGAVDLVPSHPNDDHDGECGDVNQGDENDQDGQAAAAHVALLTWLTWALPLPDTSTARHDFVLLHAAIYVTSCAPAPLAGRGPGVGFRATG
jgi:hypothetical protein